MEANPRFKTVNLYDADLKRVQKENIHLYSAAGKGEGKEEKKETKEDKKEGLKEEGREGVKKGRGVRGKEKNLLPQKEAGNRKKGLGV